MKTNAFFSILFGTCLILAYQNCTPSSNVEFSQAASKMANETGETDDNGRPYDGKIFVATGAVCPDGTRLRSRIILKTPSSADLVRYECAEIAPVALGPSDFQLNPNNSSELEYKNQTFVNTLVGTKLDMSLVKQEINNCYWLEYDFGTPTDTSQNNFQSIFQLYEDGKPLGPAHSAHVDIRNIGLGRFSHWGDAASTLRFSASDNSNPLTNGRTYTWDLK